MHGSLPFVILWVGLATLAVHNSERSIMTNKQYFVRVNTRDSNDNGSPVEGGEFFYYYDKTTDSVVKSDNYMGILPCDLERVVDYLYSIHPMLESTNGKHSENAGGAYAIVLQIGIYSNSREFVHKG